MARKRQGISFIQLQAMFPDEATAEQWWIQHRWPQGVRCVRCESKNIQERPTRKPQPYRCRACRKDFSVKTGTILHNSKLTLRQWAIAVYQMQISIKGAASTKLSEDLGITQKSAWHVGHRVREMWQRSQHLASPVEVDEVFLGGKAQHKRTPKSHRTYEGRGAVGKQAVVGLKSRTDQNVTARPIEPVSATTLQRFVMEHTEPGTTVYSDQNPGYIGLKKKGYTHHSVNHSAKQYVDGQAHTNGIESFWALLKRGYYGTYHQMSVKHIHRYVNEFSGRYNIRSLDTKEQLALLVAGSEGKRLPYQTLIQK